MLFFDCYATTGTTGTTAHDGEARWFWDRLVVNSWVGSGGVVSVYRRHGNLVVWWYLALEGWVAALAIGGLLVVVKGLVIQN